MALPSADQSVLRRYLLGTVTPESREDLEARLFSDDRIFSERLTLAEDELVGDYVQSALTDAERRDFEKHFLCTDERRAKLEFARALHAYAERSGEFERSAAVSRSGTARESRWAWLRRPMLSPAWALAAAALLVVVVQVPRFASRPGDAVSGSNVVAVSLAAGRTRAAGGELTRVRLNTDTQIVRLQLDPESTRFDTYRASLFQVDDDTLRAELRLTPSSHAGSFSSQITLTLPAESLADGDYYVRLQGISPGTNPVPLQRYDFRVLRRPETSDPVVVGRGPAPSPTPMPPENPASPSPPSPAPRTPPGVAAAPTPRSRAPKPSPSADPRGGAGTVPIPIAPPSPPATEVPKSVAPSPPPASAPSPSAPGVAPSPALDSAAAIRQLLAQFEAAYESLDVESVRRLKPSFKGFSNVLSASELTISNVVVTLAPDRQSATLRFTVQYQNRFSRAVPPEVSNPPPANVVWRVRQTPAGWIIVD